MQLSCTMSSETNSETEQPSFLKYESLPENQTLRKAFALSEEFRKSYLIPA